MTAFRETKYSKEISAILQKYGHATNSQLLGFLSQLYPEVSMTTVHRASARLYKRGKIALAPADRDGSMRYDARIDTHDHFVCNGCNRLKDIDIAQDILPIVNMALDGCRVTGRLVIYGTCESCLTVKGEAYER